MQIITIEDWKAFINANRPELDKGVEFLIPAANSMITNLLGYSDVLEQLDIFTSSPNRTKYFLSSPSASSIIDITINEETTNIPPYTLYPQGILIFRTGPRAGNMVVRYEDGGLTTIPADLTLAGCLLVDYWHKKDYRESKSFGGETVGFSPTKIGIPPHVRSILELHRRL